ncbi:MAG: c-type cytochrome [Candidatus Acidiferrales bacterium]|jgi:mono/diheme cytochrome c family protein
MRIALGVALSCLTLAAFGAQSQTSTQSPQTQEQLPPLIRSTKGSDLFRAYCASCHGVDAKGNGPVAPALKAKVPDLTVLSKDNRGQFPAARVRKVIMGDDVLAAHGSLEMPIWGPIFHQIEEDVDRGNVRLENLVKYLESIQMLR